MKSDSPTKVTPINAIPHPTKLFLLRVIFSINLEKAIIKMILDPLNILKEEGEIKLKAVSDKVLIRITKIAGNTKTKRV